MTGNSSFCQSQLPQINPLLSEKLLYRGPAAKIIPMRSPGANDFICGQSNLSKPIIVIPADWIRSSVQSFWVRRSKSKNIRHHKALKSHTESPALTPLNSRIIVILGAGDDKPDKARDS
jgi:hypothetical protein